MSRIYLNHVMMMQISKFYKLAKGKVPKIFQSLHRQLYFLYYFYTAHYGVRIIVRAPRC